MLKSQPLILHNVTLFGYRVFADLIKLRTTMVVLTPNDQGPDNNEEVGH